MGRILVIGATGLIGAPVARRLLADGHQVRLLVRDTGRASQRLGDGFEYLEGSVTDTEAVDRAVAGMNGVHVSLGVEDPVQLEPVEHRGTATVAAAAAQHGLERISYLTGSLVRVEYGPKIAEHRAKLAAEQAIQDSGVPYTFFRPTYFTNTLPRHVQGRIIVMLGRQRQVLHPVCAEDFAAQVARAFATPAAARPRFLHPRPATAHPPASTGHLPADRRARPAADHGAAAGDVGDRPAVHGRQARAEPADHGPAGPPRRARRPSPGQRAARHTHHHGRGLVPCATPALQRERRAGVNGLRFAALVLAGLLAGSELTSRLVVHPALWRLPHDAQVKAEKAMYRRFAFVDPFLMTAAVIACFAAAATEHGTAAALTFAAAGCFTVMLAMTLALNMPINLAIFRWDEEHGDPARWRQLRRRWDLIHTGRILLDSAGFALIATAVVWY